MRIHAWRALRVLAGACPPAALRGVATAIALLAQPWLRRALRPGQRRRALCARPAYLQATRRPAATVAMHGALRAFIRAVIELLRLHTITPSALLPRLRVVDPWQALPSSGRCVLVTVHAHWEMLMPVLRAIGLRQPAATLVASHGDERRDHFFAAQRAVHGLSSWPSAHAVKVLRCVAEGGVAVLAADRAGDGAPVIDDGVIALARAPLQIATRFAVPVIVVTLWQRADGSWLLLVDRPLTAGHLTHARLRRHAIAGRGQWNPFAP